MIMAVDEDGSGQMEFGEFLGILKNQSDQRTAKINKFFKDMAGGHLGKEDLPFNILV
jgi:Ca2+-binding EF-hand superfamily protein